MSAFSKLFGKKKKEFKAQCQLSKMPLDKESSYLITTAQIISSKKFWDNKMTEPETMSYTEAHFKNGDQTAGHIRKMIFEKFSKEDKPWLISDSQLHLFDVDVEKAKMMAAEWWEKEGDFIPEGTDQSLKLMDQEVFEEHKIYAINEAGRHLIAV
jgi:hypothetical protein